MPRREIITDSDACRLSNDWAVDVATMELVHRAAVQFLEETGRAVWIISGWRTRREQQQLGRRGRPAARDDLSTHRSCPATGVDVSLGALPTSAMIATWGRIAVLTGLRWGGGGRIEGVTEAHPGRPVDWGHVDRGPRVG